MFLFQSLYSVKFIVYLKLDMAVGVSNLIVLLSGSLTLDCR